MATGNMHKKFGEVRLCGFRVMRTDRQTDKHTDKLETIQRWSAICRVWPWTLTYQKFLLCIS